MFKLLVACLLVMLGFSFELFGAVHTGKVEFSTFVGRQRAQKEDNATFSGGVQIGLEVLEVGTFEFTAETGFGAYPEDDQRVRNFDIAIKSLIYNGEMFLPHISGGIGLMTFNRTKDTENPNQSKVTFAKTTINMGLGFKVRMKKDLFARLDHRYFHYSKDGNLTYRSSTSLGVSYSF